MYSSGLTLNQDARLQEMVFWSAKMHLINLCVMPLLNNKITRQTSAARENEYFNGDSRVNWEIPSWAFNETCSLDSRCLCKFYSTFLLVFFLLFFLKSPYNQICVKKKKILFYSWKKKEIRNLNKIVCFETIH